MAKRIGQTPFREILPGSIAHDETVKNSSDALDESLNKSVLTIPQLLIFARLAQDSGFINPAPMLPPLARLAALAEGLQELPEPLLDLLAWQLHVDAYESAQTIQAKRELIQSSLMLHRKKGTPWAVRHALETAMRVPASISQWFEYGGKPYFFRVRLDATGVAVDMAWIIAALQLIFDYKNVRSWLDVLETFATLPLHVYAGTAIADRTQCATRLWLEPEEEEEIPANIGIASASVTRFYANPDIPQKPVPFSGSHYPFIQTYTRSLLCPRR